MLIEEVGLKLLAEEAKLKSASMLLGPTCNIQRVSTFLCFVYMFSCFMLPELPYSSRFIFLPIPYIIPLL